MKLFGLGAVCEDLAHEDLARKDLVREELACKGLARIDLVYNHLDNHLDGTDQVGEGDTEPWFQ